MNRLRPKLFGMMAFALGAILFSPASASAGLLFQIDTYNGGAGGADIPGGPFGTVTLNGGGATVTMTVSMVSPYGFTGFAFNYTGTDSLSISESGTEVNGTSVTTADFIAGNGTGFNGFGKFDFEQDPSSSQGNSSALKTVTFTVTDMTAGGSLTQSQFDKLSTGSTPAYFAVHLINTSNGVTNQAAATGAPTPVPSPPAIPEPSTIVTALSGFGMVGLAALRRRFRRTNAASA